MAFFSRSGCVQRVSLLQWRVKDIQVFLCVHIVFVHALDGACTQCGLNLVQVSTMLEFR
jgi:hypothetical protein